MKSRTLGNSQLEVSALGFGCMGLFAYGPGPGKQAAVKLIRDASPIPSVLSTGASTVQLIRNGSRPLARGPEQFFHRHWHGTMPTTSMTHSAVQEALNGEVVDWMEKVTDEEYLAGPAC